MWICRMFQLQGSGESKSSERVRGSFTVTQLFSSMVKEKKDLSLRDNLRGTQAAFGKYLSTCLVQGPDPGAVAKMP